MNDSHEGRKVGEVYLLGSTMWRRGGHGRIYKAKPADPTVERCYRQRQNRKHKVSPSQSRFNKKQRAKIAQELAIRKMAKTEETKR